VHLTDRARERADWQMRMWQPRIRRLDASEIVGVVTVGSSSVNRYPVAKWVHVLKQLWVQRRALPALIGGPADTARIDRLASGLRHAGIPYLRLSGPLSVLDAAALIERMAGVISVDTGLAHLAVAQQIPTVVLVGGGHPGRFFPWPRAATHMALNVQMACDGCRNKCIHAEPLCVTQISPDDIVGAYIGLKTGQMPLQLFPTWTTPLQATG
jgi:ADP-heptose:LPS heptosyltransferase